MAKQKPSVRKEVPRKLRKVKLKEQQAAGGECEKEVIQKRSHKIQVRTRKINEPASTSPYALLRDDDAKAADS